MIVWVIGLLLLGILGALLSSLPSRRQGPMAPWEIEEQHQRWDARNQK